MKKCQKLKFTKKEAETALNEINRNKGKKYRHEIRIYLCPECYQKWHLTSLSKSEKQEEIPIEELIYKDQWLKLKNPDSV